MTYFLRITDDFLPEWAAGKAVGPIIYIRPRYKDDIGLLNHEKCHRWQWLVSLGLHSFIYPRSATYRLMCEVEAYKEQMKITPQYSLKYAEFIATRYNLDVTIEEAHALLLGD